jgi:hypothetical protein
MSTYTDNLWAEEMGINLDDLQREHPMHPDQLRLKRVISKQAADYWARERFLARLEYSSEAIKADTPEPVAVKTPRKKARVRSYEFTDAQLEIAFRSLDARGAV